MPQFLNDLLKASSRRTTASPIGDFNAMTRKRHPAFANFLWLIAAAVLCDCNSVRSHSENKFSYFTGLNDFSNFTESQNENGVRFLLWPEIGSPIPWNQLIVSWNAIAPGGTFLKVEAAPLLNGHEARFYTLANWSPDNTVYPRTSLRGQRDAGGTVDTDTLILNQPAHSARIRVTLGGTNSGWPTLRFIGLSFANTAVPAT